MIRSVQEKAGYRFSKWIPTHNALDWADGTLQCSEDLHHSFVLQDGLLKYCQEVLMRQTHTLLQSGSHAKRTKDTTNIDMISGIDLCWPEWHLFWGGVGGCWGKYWGKYLKFPDNHEAEQSVQSIKAKCTKGVLDLREQSVVSHLLVALQVIPGIHLVNITRHPIERISLFHHQ